MSAQNTSATACAASTWNAAQYLKFEAQRTQPAIDLARRIALTAPTSILDVGCGPGNSTRVLREQFPGADILGVDSAQTMIDAARADKANAGLRFALCDAAQGLPALGTSCFDAVFSNACIQWIPNHRALLRDMVLLLKPGGVLAVQTPVNEREPIHQIIAQLVDSAGWREKFSQPRLFHNLTQSEYYDVLSSIATGVELWETAYLHTLSSHEDILEWYRATGLRPYLDALAGADKAAFEQAVRERVQQAYPVQENGTVLFRFPRLFFLAVRADETE